MSRAPVRTMSIDEALASARRFLETDPVSALRIVERILAAAPDTAEAHRLAGMAFRALGRADDGARAELQAIRASIHDPELQQAAQALASNTLHIAEPILKKRLKEVPTDVAAIRMLAELAGRIGRYRDAENLLQRALELAPGFHAARSNLATVLHRQNRTAEALAELDVLMENDPDNPSHANLRAAALGRIGGFDEAIALYEEVLRQLPDQPKIWMSYGHVLKTVGRQQDSIEAYRHATTLQPELGEVWWSLANLKTVRFNAADIATMERALTSERLSIEDRYHLDFALGKAFEDAARPGDSFAHYAAGNQLRKTRLDHDPEDLSRQVDRAIAFYSDEFLTSRQGQGCEAADPIFILGMPRAGSTLIEQILASHSQVEGTMELPDIPALAARLGRHKGGYPAALHDLPSDELRACGEDYIARTRIQRKEGKPHFIDKLPNNWLHIGFIHLILPRAKIIDARRHPLDCCFSNFKQHFARGQSFTYDLNDVGRYYADYVRLTAHFDAVLPGRVHRVIHERLVDDPEKEIRALLNAMELPFEEECVRFHDNKRAVRTASSEQVRRPINRDGIGQWQAYSDFLEPLRGALGPVLDDYPVAFGM